MTVPPEDAQKSQGAKLGIVVTRLMAKEHSCQDTKDCLHFYFKEIRLVEVSS